MKRQISVEYEDASAGVRAIYEEGMKVMGLTQVPNWMKAMGKNEFILKANWEKFRYVVLEGDVPQLLKQLILFIISINVGNQYCTAAHGHAALALDPTLSYDDLINLSKGQANATLPKAFRVAIEVVTQVALNPKGVLSDDFDFERRLKDEGFSEREIDELMAQADFGLMFNAITDIWDIPVEHALTPHGEPRPSRSGH